MLGMNLKFCFIVVVFIALSIGETVLSAKFDSNSEGSFFLNIHFFYFNFFYYIFFNYL